MGLLGRGAEDCQTLHVGRVDMDLAVKRHGREGGVKHVRPVVAAMR